MLRCALVAPLADHCRQRFALDANAIIWEVLDVPLRDGRSATWRIALEVTDATFEAEVLQSDKPVLVDFWAPWCAPCRAVGAVLDKLSGERDDLKIVKINIDDNQDQAVKHSVMVLPTIILYKEGEAVGKLQGGVPPTAIARLLQRACSSAGACPCGRKGTRRRRVDRRRIVCTVLDAITCVAGDACRRRVDQHEQCAIEPEITVHTGAHGAAGNEGIAPNRDVPRPYRGWTHASGT